jgi:hypothetical protein
MENTISSAPETKITTHANAGEETVNITSPQRNQIALPTLDSTQLRRLVEVRFGAHRRTACSPFEAFDNSANLGNDNQITAQ